MSTKAELVGRSEAMVKLDTWIAKAARSPAPVLLVGESGTGKGLVAQELHRRSARSSGPFVVADLGTVPAHLAESELFGHVQGAYTGAVGERRGAFRKADGGVLFLDEVANAPPEIQAKLLRAVEDHQVVPLGTNAPAPVDVRLVAATNADLRDRLAAGEFREDLYHRLSVLRQELPPLRERDGDLELLVPHLLERAMDEFRLERGNSDSTPEISEEAWQAIRMHSWPGNVRELLACLRRAVVLADQGVIRARDLQIEEHSSLDVGSDGPEASSAGVVPRGGAPPVTRSGDPAGVDAAGLFVDADGRLLTWDEVQRAYLRAALEAAHGNVSAAARKIGVSRGWLRYRLLQLKIDPGPES